METITLIISCAALALAAGALWLQMRAKSEAREKAGTEERRRRAQSSAMRALAKETQKAIKMAENAQKAGIAQDVLDRIANLERGVIPDYEQAKAAAQAVNDFSAGLSGILNFDPYAALQAGREKDARGDEI